MKTPNNAKRYKPTTDLKDFQFYQDLHSRTFTLLRESSQYKQFFFNSYQQVMLDTPRLSFDVLINQWFSKAAQNEMEAIKKVLQDICDYALKTYLLRNSQYMYIQCMGTQMRFFVEYVIDEDIDSQIKKGDKQTGTLYY